MQNLLTNSLNAHYKAAVKRVIPGGSTATETEVDSSDNSDVSADLQTWRYGEGVMDLERGVSC